MKFQRINYSRKENDFPQMFIQEYKEILEYINNDLAECRVDKLCCLDIEQLKEIKQEERMLKHVKKAYQVLIQKNLN